MNRPFSGLFRRVSAALLGGGIAAFAVFPVSAAETCPSSGTPDGLMRFAFTVNAYVKIPSSPAEKGREPRTAWRKNVGTAFPVGGGFLVTLNCVVRNAEKIRVIGSTGREYAAEMVGFDKGSRLTVIRIDDTDSVATPPVKAVKSVKPGAPVLFLGTSSGGKITVKRGSVGSVRPGDGLMVVDVEGDPGTSGTPVFDDGGMAVGLLAYRLEEKGAAPHTAGIDSYIVLPLEYASLQARSIINRCVAKSGWLGVSLSVNGMTVREVAPESPAEKCGIRPGDKIVAYNGATVSGPGDLVRAVGETRAGDTVKIRLMRNGESITTSTKLSTFPNTLRK